MMPTLRNGRHEVFAKALADGKSASEAYRAAGYQCAPHKARGHGHRLRTREDIVARIDELFTEARGRIAEPEPAANWPSQRKRPTLPKFQQKRRAGRPPIYEEAFCPRARKLALLGLTEGGQNLHAGRCVRVARELPLDILLRARRYARARRVLPGCGAP